MDRERAKQEGESEDAPTDPGFAHSAGTDLAAVLDTYARADRRVLDRRSGTRESRDPGAIDRRALERRAPTSAIAEGADVTRETS